jgi:SAM-dependent methyltransferase
MTSQSTFDTLLGEGNSEPVEGWNFSWLSGRAVEGRPSWKYFESLSERMRTANAVLDVQTGGGERFAEILSRVPHHPSTLAATESWPPNVEIARNTLGLFGVSVLEVPDDAPFPFEDETFDLVCSRHPTVTLWTEIERVLQTEGIYYSQQVGAGTNSELTDFIMGQQPISNTRRMDRAISLATSAGLEVIDAREESLPVNFFDVGAVVYFLRKVIWTVPDFSTDKYRERLKLLHEYIEQTGSFKSHSQRFLIEARKPRVDVGRSYLVDVTGPT